MSKIARLVREVFLYTENRVFDAGSVFVYQEPRV